MFLGLRWGAQQFGKKHLYTFKTIKAEKETAYDQAESDIEENLCHTFGAGGECELSGYRFEILIKFYKINLNKMDLVLQQLREILVKLTVIISGQMSSTRPYQTSYFKQRSDVVKQKLQLYHKI